MRCIFLCTLPHLRAIFTASNYCVSIKMSQRLQIMCQKFVSPFVLFSILVLISLFLFPLNRVPLKMRTANRLFARGLHSRTRCNSGVELLFFFFSSSSTKSLNLFQHLLFSDLFPESSSPSWVTFLATTTNHLWIANN
jgi:hypothetical protein